MPFSDKEPWPFEQWFVDVLTEQALGVYGLLNEKKEMHFIGSGLLKSRLRGLLEDTDPDIPASSISWFLLEPVGSIEEARALEDQLIEEYDPPGNRRFR